VIEVHSEIHYVPLGKGWEEVVVCYVLHHVPIAAIAAMVRSQSTQSSNRCFLGTFSHEGKISPGW
jgi:hypothetical protein